MLVYVTELGSDRRELTEILLKEGVTFQECRTGAVKELGTASYGIIEVQANLPEVQVPPEYSGATEGRAWRLPSGRLIITDQEDSLEQITPPVP